ncbi:efflux transporter outer membrane subunit [Robbsia andropogonis]|uniref:efflux transporter outer membrane subunit n=1 Tax=Robbsia andropogonis TaxID=28092 RepID=UPI00209F8F04|nr:efflux transporter outer membrane subunit [Robbsia andropogonis]MCP1116532.1 efflux transporter outer membrane subunit [Robbsia andropogonis]MCP1126789.1 efflux transporter outer membrane subunit [Robbsia andropogonis]
MTSTRSSSATATPTNLSSLLRISQTAFIAPRPRPSRRFAGALVTVAVLTALGLTGCTVGPDYKGAPNAAPDTLKANAFRRTPDTGIATSPGISRWWTTLNDAELNSLIDRALAHNPDIQAAEARLRASRAALSKEQANELPKVSGSGTVIRARRPDSLGNLLGGSGPIQNFSASFLASWEIDLFGGTRRAIEAAGADAQVSEANLADAHVSLAAEVAQAYIDLRAQQQRITLANQSATAEQKILDLTQQRRDRGTAGDVDVERTRTQVDTTRASIAPINSDLGESLDRLAVLCGMEPGALDAELSPSAPLPAVPAEVAIGDPTAMLQRRPDIRAAERKLAEATAQIGQQKAAFFPKLTLYGDLGFSGTQPAHLFRKSNAAWLGVPYLSWNVLDFGRTAASVHSAEAQRDAAEADYRKAVLEALRDADTALSRYGHQRENVVQLMAVQASATRSATLVEQRYRAGAASMIDWLDAERTRLSAERDTVSGKAQLVQDFVTIQKSLGLGWNAH